MAYEMAATAVSLNDLEGHSLVARLFKCNRRTSVQHFIRFQLTVCSHGFSALAEVLVTIRLSTVVAYLHGHPQNFAEEQELETIEEPNVSSETRSDGVPMECGLRRDAIAPLQYRGSGDMPRNISL